MFNQLSLFELVIMAAGVILFLILSFALIFYIVKGKPIAALWPFFLLPIIMIGWPTITSFSISKDTVEIKKLGDSVAQNPGDTAARKQLEQSIAKIDTSRIVKDPAALTVVSNAYYVLGKYDSAMLYTNKALKVSPEFTDALQLKKTIQNQVIIRNNFQNNIKQIELNLDSTKDTKPITSNAKAAKVVDLLNSTQVPQYTDEKSNLVVAKGLAAVNKSDKSLEIINKVLAANPSSTEAIQLKKEVEQNKVEVKPSVSNIIIDTKKFNNAYIRKQ